jgi:hypothetical protein
MMKATDLINKIDALDDMYTLLDKVDFEALTDEQVATLSDKGLNDNEKNGLQFLKTLVSRGGRPVVNAIKQGSARYGVDKTGALRVFTPDDEDYDTYSDYRTPIEALHFQPGIDSLVETRYPTRSPGGMLAGAEVAPRSQHTVFGGDPMLSTMKNGAADVVQDVISQGTKFAAPVTAALYGGSTPAVLAKTLIPLAVSMGGNAYVDSKRGEDQYSDNVAQDLITAGAGATGAVLANKIAPRGLDVKSPAEVAQLLAQKLNYGSAKELMKAHPNLLDQVMKGLESGSTRLYSRSNWVNQPLVDFDAATGGPDLPVKVQPFNGLTNTDGTPIPRNDKFKVDNELLHRFMKDNGIPITGKGSLSDPEREGLRKWLEKAWSDPWSDMGRLFFPQDEIVEPTMPDAKGTAVAEPTAFKSNEIPGEIIRQEGTRNKITKGDLVRRLSTYDKFKPGTGNDDAYWTSKFLRERASLDDPAMQEKWVQALDEYSKRHGYAAKNFRTGSVVDKGAPPVKETDTPLVSPTEYRTVPKHPKLRKAVRFTLPLAATAVAEAAADDIVGIAKRWLLPTGDR